MKWSLFFVPLIVAFNVLIYSNTFNLAFSFDDYGAIIKNADVDPKTPISNLLKHDFWGQDISSPISHKSFRPLTILTFRWNRQFFQRPESIPDVQCPEDVAKSFHVVNLIIQIATCLSLYAFICFLINLGRKSSSHATEVAAFLATIYFSAHPVHVEAVTGIVGRADLLCCLFSLLGTICYIKSCCYDDKCSSWTKESSLPEANPNEPYFFLPWQSWVFLFLSFLFGFAAVAAKELGLATFGVYLVAEIIIGSSKQYRSLLEFLKNRKSMPMFVRLILTLGFALFLLHLREVMTYGFVVPVFRRAENPLQYLKGKVWFLSVLAVQHRYFVQALFPTVLSADYSFNQIEKAVSVFDYRCIFAGIIYLIFAAGLVVAAVRCGKRIARKAILAMAWIAGFFFPASHWIFYAGTTVAERLLYVPTAGMATLFALFISSVILSTLIYMFTL